MSSIPTCIASDCECSWHVVFRRWFYQKIFQCSNSVQTGLNLLALLFSSRWNLQCINLRSKFSLKKINCKIKEVIHDEISFFNVKSMQSPVIFLLNLYILSTGYTSLRKASNWSSNSFLDILDLRAMVDIQTEINKQVRIMRSCNSFWNIHRNSEKSETWFL